MHRDKSSSRLTGDFVVSITSHPPRLSFVVKAIKQLAQQTLLPKLVQVNLPDSMKNDFTLADIGQMPFEIEVDFLEDFGPAMKLLPTISKFPNRCIITVDDDVIYPPNRFKELYEAGRTTEARVICSMSRIVPTERLSLLASYASWPLASNGLNIVRDFIPLGAEGVLYKPRAMHPIVNNLDLMRAASQTTDDFWFWFASRLQGSALLCLGSFDRSLRMAGSQEHALWNTNRLGPNDESFRTLSKLLRQDKIGVGTKFTKLLPELIHYYLSRVAGPKAKDALTNYTG